MGGADAAWHWDLSFEPARVLELHVAGAGFHAGCGRDYEGGFGGDDGAVAGLSGVRAAPHPPFGHLLPRRGAGEGEWVCLLPFLLTGEGARRADEGDLKGG